eukprot:3941752-Rhodomonas_salina.1
MSVPDIRWCEAAYAIALPDSAYLRCEHALPGSTTAYVSTGHRMAKGSSIAYASTGHRTADAGIA